MLMKLIFIISIYLLYIIFVIDQLFEIPINDS